MSKEQEHEAPASPIQERQARRWKDLGGAWSVFRWLVVTATAWYLLKELAPILRPLLLAIFLAYVILPIRLYVQGQTRGGLGHLALFVGLCLVLAAFGVVAYGDVVGLAHDVPRLHQRVNDLTGEATRYADAHIPALADTIRRTAFAEEQGAARLQDALGSLVNMTAGVAIEAVQVAFFLILILFEAARFPRRMQNAFANEKTDRMFTMVGSINAAIASYLKAKVKVNIV